MSGQFGLVLGDPPVVELVGQAAVPHRDADRWGTAGPGEDLFALWHRTPPETGLWVPVPV